MKLFKLHVALSRGKKVGKESAHSVKRGTDSCSRTIDAGSTNVC